MNFQPKPNHEHPHQLWPPRTHSYTQGPSSTAASIHHVSMAPSSHCSSPNSPVSPCPVSVSGISSCTAHYSASHCSLRGSARWTRPYACHSQRQLPAQLTRWGQRCAACWVGRAPFGVPVYPVRAVVPGRDARFLPLISVVQGRDGPVLGLRAH